MPSRAHTFARYLRLPTLFVAVVLLWTNAYAANSVDFIWARQGVTTNSADAYRIVVDSAGSVFIAGSFANRFTFGGTTLIGHGFQDDIFIAKYDGQGNLLWSRSAGGSGTDYALGIAVDSIGNVYATGSFQYVADFGNVSITNRGGGGGLFLAKYDSQGNLVWVKKATGESVRGQSAAVDAQGNVFVTGTFAQTAYFDSLSISTRPAVNIFVAKYDRNGIPLWVRQATTNSLGYGIDVASDQSGNCYITGFYNTAATFGGITLTAGSDADGIFLVRYDSEGNVIWARQGAGPRPPGGDVSDAGNKVSTDRWGNIYLSGYFSGPITFDSFNLTGAHGRMLLAKYDSLGSIQWIREGGGTGGGFSTADPSGDVYLTGFWGSGTVFFDGVTFTNEADHIAFVAKYDSMGTFRGLVQVKGTGAFYGFATAVEAHGSTYLTGIVGQTPALLGTNVLSSGPGIRTVYIAKIEPFPPSLNIKRNSAGVVLGWPLWATNYQLENTAAFTNAGMWFPITNKSYSVGGESVFTNTSTNFRSFFRLRKN
jgi:hypothetical protein